MVRDIKAGNVLTKENVRAIRPGLGLPTKFPGEMLGKIVIQDVKRRTALNWEMLG
jgi:N-acetylneuraminate synthase